MGTMIEEFDTGFEDQEPQGITSTQLHAMLRESLHWSPRQMWSHQSLQLEQFLRHAREHVPFYKTRLDCLFRPDGSIDWRRWQDVPLVMRKDLQVSRQEMLSPFLPPGHGGHGTSTSSGSTGVPVSLEISKLALYVASHAWSRAHALHGINPGTGITEFKAFLPNGTPMTEQVLRIQAKGTAVSKVWIKRTLSTEEKLALLRDNGTPVLLDTPNHMEVLAHENLRCSNPARLSAVVGIGMPISPFQEELFGRSFGAHTFSPYSSKEGTLMAFQCAHTRGNFHVNAELVLLEVLDEHNQPSPLGAPGKVVITPFFNAAQPLIRYVQGDIVVRGPPCPCGNTLPVLAEIRGRSDAIFRFPGKMVAMTRFDDNLVQTQLAADAFQFAQVAPEHIVVRYVSPAEADASSQDTVARHLLHILQVEDIRISFQKVDHIPFNAGGKQQRVTREF
jgi:phenylacetate-CoA ligase